MKRLSLLLLSLLGIVLLHAPSARAAVNDFQISKYDIDFTLSRDNDNRSRLTTKETITAVFPQTSQNHGIERYIPKSYDNHPVDIDIQSVLREDGSQWNYTTYDSGDYTVIRIGDADKYVHGSQTFVLSYVQRDVTRYFADGNVDEFYWDTNGTEWRVPIQSLNVSLTLDQGLADLRNGAHTCYQGRYGSNDTCELTVDGLKYTAAATDLSPNENITLAVGFKPQTFTAYKKSLLNILLIGWVIVQILLFIPGILLILFLTVCYHMWGSRRSEVGTIVPEYIPPKDTSVQTAAAVIQSAYGFSAQLIDFAVRHYIKIYETKAKSFWSSAQYEIEIVKPIDDLRDEEREILNDIFGGNTIVGSRINTKSFKNNRTLSMSLLDNPKKLQKLMRESYGLHAKDEIKSKWFKRFAVVCSIGGLVLLSPLFLIIALIALIMSYTLWPLTDKGLALYRYLQGLKMYIEVAEEERLRMMQSPEGAQKVSVDSSDPKQLIKLYERVLSYAVLLGQEKEWNKQLGNYYQSTNTQPDWYAGANLVAFNAAAFSRAMSNLTSSISSSGASFSSSGGSSGGGSSGGGGGGGGGGGW